MKINKGAAYNNPIKNNIEPNKKTSKIKNKKIVDKVIIDNNKPEKETIGSKIKNWFQKNVTGTNNTKRGYQHYPYHGSDFSNKSKMYAAIGASAGGAIGTGIGLWKGYEGVKKNEASLQWKTHDIKDPELEGFSHYASEDGHYERYYIGDDSEGNPQYDSYWVTDGYHHRYSPDIRYDKVGEYKTPYYKNSSKLTHLTGGLIGMAGGAAAGGATGLALALIQKLIGKTN